MNRVLGILAAALALAALPVLAHAQVIRVDRELLPAAFAEAERMGLTMNGYRDAPGLRRVVEHYFEEYGSRASMAGPRTRTEDPLTRLPDQRGMDLPENLRELGLDLQTIREIETLARGIDLSIYRVEFMPGFTGRGVPGVPSLDAGEGLGLEDDGLTPGFPTGESLASDRLSWTYQRTDTRRETRAVYPDGSHRWQVKAVLPNGDVWTEEGTASSDGTITYFNVRVQNPKTGETRSQVRDQELGEPSNVAEEERRRDERREEEAREEGEAGDGNGEGEAGDDAEEVDQYQPAEGGAGTFCPLVVEICRRGLQQAVASGQTVRVGRVLINPGDPDDQPRGARLVYDPEGLVINPEARQSRRDPASVDRRVFQMEIPVWVNPPGPGDPQAP